MQQALDPEGGSNIPLESLTDLLASCSSALTDNAVYTNHEDFPGPARGTLTVAAQSHDRQTLASDRHPEMPQLSRPTGLSGTGGGASTHAPIRSTYTARGTPANLHQPHRRAKWHAPGRPTPRPSDSSGPAWSQIPWLARRMVFEDTVASAPETVRVCPPLSPGVSSIWTTVSGLTATASLQLPSPRTDHNNGGPSAQISTHATSAPPQETLLRQTGTPSQSPASSPAKKASSTPAHTHPGPSPTKKHRRSAKRSRPGPWGAPTNDREK